MPIARALATMMTPAVGPTISNNSEDDRNKAGFQVLVVFGRTAKWAMLCHATKKCKSGRAKNSENFC